MLVAACSAEPAPAQAIERRLLAPCCLRQTLEDHDSPVAHALRDEIERRVSTGEPAAAIEADLVRRHGEAMRAMPPGWDPRPLLGAALGAGILLGTLALLRLLRRGRRRSTTAGAPQAHRATPGELAAYQLRLDDELLDSD